MPIEEVIERGREIGLSINPSDVHSTRYYMRQDAARSAPKVETVAASSEDAGDVATMVRRNYQLLDSQRVSEVSPAENPNGRKSRVADGRVKSATAPGKKLKSASIIEGDVASLEDTLRRIVTRLGTDRAREIIEAHEASRLRDSQR